MPLARAGDLSRRAGLYKDNADSVVQVARQLANALHVAHQAGIIHRDVKPQNILFPSESHDVWPSDFGICLIRDQDRTTGAAEVVGPVQFMAPELEGGGKLDVTAAADVYSLGKVIDYMLSGGTVLPRERLYDAEYTGVFTRGGERQRLLQVMLAKMICSLPTRLQTMVEVLGEIERIDTWSRDALVLSFANHRVSLRVYPDRLVAEGHVICEHARLIERSHHVPGRTIYDWRHYLAVIQRKPGALRNGAPFADFPEAFRQLQRHLLKQPGGDREMVEILALILHHDEEAVLCAVELALSDGAPTMRHAIHLEAAQHHDNRRAGRIMTHGAPPPALSRRAS